MSIEKCIYFKRTTIDNGKSETQYCGASKVEVQCGGFSDHCEFPVMFVPDRFVPRDKITFKPQAYILDGLLTQRRHRNRK